MIKNEHPIKVTCPFCGGEGQIKVDYHEYEPCYDCEGTGKIDEEDLDCENITREESDLEFEL